MLSTRYVNIYTVPHFILYPSYRPTSIHIVYISCTATDIDADAATSLVTHGSLEGAVERLVQQVASREAGLSASHREELSLTNKQ